ncbi:cysteine proteinase [Massarina eburnea CBS 473.64]|uniref:Cysteine proteinase n=1 Tax=Massarina eburnea CBS 473.64 TaxID=1395130 RepID=A0A6A6RN82_9PLEO|nr:cysteine proteinase [Massarina eburnea CBS 473.64]
MWSPSAARPWVTTKKAPSRSTSTPPEDSAKFDRSILRSTPGSNNSESTSGPTNNTYRPGQRVRFQDAPSEPNGQPQTVHQSQSSPPVTVFGHSIYREDLMSLQSEGWYTCTIISVYSDWLTKEIIVPTATYDGSLPRVSILLPSHMQLIKDTHNLNNDGPDALSSIEGLDMLDFLLVPINTPQSRGGGSHWSLLIVGIKHRKAWHLDSSSHLNIGEAANFLSRFTQVMPQLYGIKDDGTDWTLAKEHGTPQDTTSTNCGPITCWLMKVILIRMCEPHQNWGMRSIEEYWSVEGLLPHTAFAQIRSQMAGLVGELVDLRTVWVVPS